MVTGFVPPRKLFSGCLLTPRKIEVTWFQLLQATLSEITALMPEMMAFLVKQNTPLPFLDRLKWLSYNLTDDSPCRSSFLHLQNGP